MSKELAEQGTILRAEVGSGVHGLAIKGRDDRDEMGICIEPPEYVLGLETFEQYIYRDQPEGVRSQPGDLDLTIYSLRKWMRLAIKGNPSILLLLFAPDSALVTRTQLGKELQELAPAIVSRQAGPRFLGYLEAQKQRLLRERGTAHVPNRGDKDAKYASHMLRLGYQGLELLQTGRITLPMPEYDLHVCREVKLGRATLDSALQTAGVLAREIKDLLLVADGLIPDAPDMDAVNAWMVKAHEEFWVSEEEKKELPTK